ncbi:MAG: DUF1573 domain-containing protein [Janthinobacterium lividum]
MNKMLLLALGLAFAGSYTAQAQTAPAGSMAKADGPQIKVMEDKYDFGTIKQGASTEHVFKFKNVGTKPLVISNIGVSCGCTVADWSKDPIAPGKMSTLKATFNSAGKMGAQTKVLTIESNSVGGAATATLTGNVVEPNATIPATADVSGDDGKQKMKDGDAKLKAKVKKS